MYYECSKGVTKCKVAVIHEPNEQLLTAQCLACVPHSVLAVCGADMQKFLRHEGCPASDILYSFSWPYICTCIQSFSYYSAADVHPDIGAGRRAD